MSERDDDLVTLLRADLADAASTTPREGFEMRMLDAVHGTATGRRGRFGAHWFAGPAVALATATVLAAVVGAGVALRHTSTSTPARPGPQVSPSAPPARAGLAGMFVMVDADRLAPGETTPRLHASFVRADGSVAQRVALPGDTRFETVGGDRLFYVLHGEPLSVGLDGTQVEGNPMTGMGDDPAVIDRSFAVSPDGTRWVWSTSRAEGGSLRTRVFLGGRGRSEQTVVNQVFPPSSPHTLRVLGWKDAGIVIATVPNGVGGGPTFYDSTYWLGARLLDPDTLAVRTLPLPGQCRFEDVAADGSFTCVPMQDQATVLLVRPDGSVRTLHIPGNAAFSGDAMISLDGRRVAVGTSPEAAGEEDPFPPGKLRTMVLDVAAGTAVQANARGMVPAAWLPDGTLVLENETNPGEAGRPAGAELLRPDGSVVQLGTGSYLGMLDAVHARASWFRTAVPPYANPSSPSALG